MLSWKIKEEVQTLLLNSKVSLLDTTKHHNDCLIKATHLKKSENTSQNQIVLDVFFSI